MVQRKRLMKTQKRWMIRPTRLQCRRRASLKVKKLPHHLRRARETAGLHSDKVRPRCSNIAHLNSAGRRISWSSRRRIKSRITLRGHNRRNLPKKRLSTWSQTSWLSFWKSLDWSRTRSNSSNRTPISSLWRLSVGQKIWWSIFVTLASRSSQAKMGKPSIKVIEAYPLPNLLYPRYACMPSKWRNATWHYSAEGRRALKTTWYLAFWIKYFLN